MARRSHLLQYGLIVADELDGFEVVDQASECVVDSCASDGSSFERRRKSAVNIDRFLTSCGLGGEDPEGEPIKRRSGTIPGGIEDPVQARSSQNAFAEASQTFICFDWDDTLFPTSYLFDTLKLDNSKFLKDQKKITTRLKTEVAGELLALEKCVIKLLTKSLHRGKVVLVTLARPPWVREMCRVFFPVVGELIKTNRIEIIYAQEGESVDYEKLKMMEENASELKYAILKGKAIKKAVSNFYSSYDGQSWKNIISIGDSNFERLGTIMMAIEYRKDKGIDSGQEGNAVEVNGHVFKVRTKTLMMMDRPSIVELTAQVKLLVKWMPLMVKLDSGLDVDLYTLEDEDVIDKIERILVGGVGTEPR